MMLYMMALSRIAILEGGGIGYYCDTIANL